MTDNQAMEITEGLAEQLKGLLSRAKGPWLSLPGDPAWLIERDEQAGIDRGINKLLLNNLPAIIAALSRPATPAAGDAEVERVRIVAWLRNHECSGLIREEPFDEAADAIERGDHHA